MSVCVSMQPAIILFLKQFEEKCIAHIDPIWTKMTLHRTHLSSEALCRKTAYHKSTCTKRTLHKKHLYNEKKTVDYFVQKYLCKKYFGPKNCFVQK